MNQTIIDILDVFKPLIEVAIMSVGLPAIAIVSAKIVGSLKIKDEAEQAKTEKAISDALHQSAFNAIRFAANRAGIPITAIAAATTPLHNAVLADAVDYVKDKNPDALRKLGVNGQQLLDIILSKVPPK